MECVAPSCECDQNNSGINSTQGITYFKFPLEPSLRAAWLERLHKKDWQPEENSAVCSKHFLPDDIVETSNGLQTLRDGAVPVVTVQVCRICFAMDCKLYPLITYNRLYKAYETLTGLLIQRDNIPPYLCNECAHQMLKCVHFRNKSLEAHSILMEISTKHKCITLESIKSVHGIQNPLASKEAHEQSVLYDIDMEVAEMENLNNRDQTDTRPPSVLPEQIILDFIKLESDKTPNQDITSYKSLTKNVMVHIAVEQDLQEDIGIDSCKAEENGAMNDAVNNELKDNDKSKETLEGVATDDSPQSEDVGQNDDESNTELQDVWVVIEEVNPTKEDTSSETEPEERPIQGHITNEITFNAGIQNAKETVEDEPSLTNVATYNDKPVVSASSLEAEGDDSLPLGEVSQETEESSTRAHEMRTVIEKEEYINDDIQGNPDGITGHVNGKLTCDKCPFQTINKVQMSSHLKAHAASTSHNCSLCNYKTIHKRSLAWHTRVHSGEKPFHCDRCNKTFSQESSVRVHMRQHSGKKPYSCNVCKRNFTEISTLRRHLVIHTGEKPYLCDICNKGFRQIGHLRNHLRTHTGEKSYVCNYCNKAFGQKSHLIKHIRIHTDDLRYACKICNKIFRRDITFKNHMRKHSSKKSYSCEVCKKVFSQRSCLRVHWKKHV